MKTTSAVAALAVAGSAAAQSSLCDKYATALLNSTSASAEYTLLKYIVNTAVIGNGASGVPKPSIPGVTFPTNVTVPGILNPNGTYNGNPVNLLPYFDGGLASSNRGGMAYAVNFLDDGGAAPLQMNMPANGTSSNQYKLLTHLYQYFGSALMCSGQSNMTSMSSNFSAYAGVPSMYSVHQFMDLDVNQMGYFIDQVGLSAASFGVSMADVMTVGNLLNTTFGMQCSAAATVIPASAGPQLQAICIASNCPAANATAVQNCPYSSPVSPGIANAALAAGQGNSSNTATASYSSGASMASTMSGMSSMSTGAAGGAGGATTTASGGSTGSTSPSASGASTSPSSAASSVKVGSSFLGAVFAALAFAL